MALLGKVFWAGWARPGWKTLQCPGWPLCGVVILAVCFLASGLGSLVPFLTAQGDARRKHRLLCVERFMMSLHLHSNHEVGQWVILDNRVSTHAISSDPHK